MEQGITLERAQELIRAKTKPVESCIVPLGQALGRVLAQPVVSRMDQPPFDRSPLDGYALLAFDTVGADHASPAKLRVIDTVYAGGWSEAEVGPGQAVRIMTGAPIPRGADCVIRQEDTDMGQEIVSVYQTLKSHENYCFRGEDFKTGEVLAPRGAVLNAAVMGVLASAGYRADSPVEIRKPLRVAVLCTGDELVTGDVAPLPKGKIYSSNQTYLTARLTELGIEAVSDGKQWGDDPEAVAGAVSQALLDADAVITTGGVSVGEKDIFHEALPLMGAEQVFWRVKLKPGTPLMYSLLGGKPILSLSGNPFAAAATFELLGRPLLAALAGNPAMEPVKVMALLGTDFPKKSGVRRFVRAILRDGRAVLPEGHSSGQLRSSVGTNCLVEFPAGSGGHLAGETVTAYLL